MKTFLYLSLIPEALIASHLPPEDFGTYLAVGSKKRSRGQAIFFEVDPAFESDELPVKDLETLCQPHEGNQPRRSTYLSIYRALEHVPMSALGKLYLTTDDGIVLGLEAQPYEPVAGRKYHLYQEFCPVTPRVVSNLGPREFCQRITDRSQMVSISKIVFAELKLENLALDPEANNVDNLPYHNIEHLRDCLRELLRNPGKATKTVVRAMYRDVLFRTIRGGFYVGDQTDFRYYPLPSREQLESDHYIWWRSALMTFGY